MSGMNSGINVNDPTVIAAFKTALVHQGIIALLIFALLGFAWITVRAWLPAAHATGGTADGMPAAAAEPAWRQLLRIGFGLLWVFDGILQAQPKMAIGLPSQVIQPTAASSPHWVQQVVNWAGTTWSYHPMQAGASAVWIQVGIGVWMLASSRGPLSRLAGLASAGWGLVVWVFGESFGGIFAPGLTWLFGAPGAVLIYVVAGGLIALPERAWHARWLGRAILAGTGLFLIGMAVLQAWPGRGFWQGTAHHQPGDAGRHDQRYGADTAAGFPGRLGRRVHRLRRGARVRGQPVRRGGARGDRCGVPDRAAAAGPPGGYRVHRAVPGGLGADRGLRVLRRPGHRPQQHAPVRPARRGRLPRAHARPGRRGGTSQPRRAAAGWRERIRPASVRRSVATASIRSVAVAGALGLIILGAAPMAAAQASPNADPILAEAIAGSTAPLNFPAKAFQLTDQHGRTVSLASLRGKVVLLTFLDPVCTSDCPLIAQEFRAAGQLLGASARKVELVAVVANPVYHQVAYTQAFDRQEHLTQVPNWLYLTGSVPQLQQVWKDYGIAAQILPAGSMIGHPDIAYVIDQAGQVRAELNTDPGPGTTATKSSFAVLLAGAARNALRSS